LDRKRIVKLGGVAMLIVTMLPVTAAYQAPRVDAAPGAAGGEALAQTKARTNQAADVPPDTSAFTNVWNRTDALVASGSVKRSWLWGPQAFWTTRELYLDDPTGTESRLVQYWDKSRMEINNPNGNKNDPFYVTNGLLSVELISGKMQTGNNSFEDRKPAQVNIAGDFDDPTAPTYASFVGKANAGGDHPDPNKMGQKVINTIARDGQVGVDPAKNNVPGVEIAYYDDVTKHNIPKAMWDFLNASGPVRKGNQTVNEAISTPWFYATGRPISDAYWGKIKIAGRPTDALIQAFERRVLTYVPTNPAGFQVEFGNIGAHYRDWRYLSAGKLNDNFPLKGQHIGYGFNVQLYYTDKDRVHQTSRDAGFNWARQQVAWRDIQGKNLLFAWGELDAVVESAVRNKQKLLLSIAKSPDWASPRTKGGMPENPLDFGNFMYMLARRYKGKVQAYEVWNEQNYGPEVGGAVTVAPYVELLKYGYTGVKMADPNAIVLFGGLTPTSVTNNLNLALDDVEYLKQIYAYQGGIVKNYYDVLGAHPGSNANAPDEMWPDKPGSGKCPPKYASQEGNCWKDKPSFYFRRIEQQYAVMEAAGEGQKQMWLTEFGWSTYNVANGYEYGQLISPDVQAQYLVRAFEKGKNEYPWMGVMFVWNLNFSTLGLSPEDEKVPWSVVNPDWSPRLAFLALKAIEK
jgi:hypothetical protein